MSSLRKLESARASGARSHGPVTAEGKQRSAQNAMRHGPLTRCLVLDNEESIGLVLRYDTRLHCMYQRPPKSLLLLRKAKLRNEPNPKNGHFGVS